MTELHCGSCGASPSALAPWQCPTCGSPLDLDLPPADPATFVEDVAGGVWRYRGWLPARRSGHARGAADGPRRVAGRRSGGLREARGRAPDRLVQGPRDRRYGLVATRSRRWRDHRRLVRQRWGVVRRLRDTRGAPGARVRASRCVARKAAPGAWRTARSWLRCRAPVPRRAMRPAPRSTQPGRTWPTPRTSGSRRSWPARRRSPTKCSSSWGVGRPMRSSRLSAVARCYLAPILDSGACARRV